MIFCDKHDPETLLETPPLFVSKSDELCIENEEFCIRNDKIALTMMNFAVDGNQGRPTRGALRPAGRLGYYDGTDAWHDRFSTAVNHGCIARQPVKILISVEMFGFCIEMFDFFF